METLAIFLSVSLYKYGHLRLGGESTRPLRLALLGLPGPALALYVPTAVLALVVPLVWATGSGGSQISTSQQVLFLILSCFDSSQVVEVIGPSLQQDRLLGLWESAKLHCNGNGAES